MEGPNREKNLKIYFSGSRKRRTKPEIVRKVSCRPIGA